LVYERSIGWRTTLPFSEPEIFEFPEGIGAVECVNVEHEEVNMLPRTISTKKVTFKYGLGAEFIKVLKMLNTLGLDRTKQVRVRSAQGPVDVSPRDMLAAVLPDPAKLGPQMTGKICSGVLVIGRDKNGTARATYLYNVADNNETMAEYEAQCVVVQAAMGPVIALELIANGIWRGAGVLGAEAFDSTAYLDLMASTTAYNQQWYTQERLSSAPLSSPTF
jgi:saccharopine dehydrogenase-like NADP-dependent oxidoreductase